MYSFWLMMLQRTIRIQTNYYLDNPLRHAGTVRTVGRSIILQFLVILLDRTEQVIAVIVIFLLIVVLDC